MISTEEMIQSANSYMTEFTSVISKHLCKKLNVMTFWVCIVYVCACVLLVGIIVCVCEWV